MGRFEELKVWRLSKNLSVEIYRLMERGSLIERDFRLKAQMCAAAVSIASNIAEGDELQSSKQAVRHFYIAKGSCAELKTQLIIAHEIGYIKELDYKTLVNMCEHVSAMLFKLISSRRKAGGVR